MHHHGYVNRLIIPENIVTSLYTFPCHPTKRNSLFLLFLVERLVVQPTSSHLVYTQNRTFGWLIVGGELCVCAEEANASFKTSSLFLTLHERERFSSGMKTWRENNHLIILLSLSAQNPLFSFSTNHISSVYMY